MLCTLVYRSSSLGRHRDLGKFQLIIRTSREKFGTQFGAGPPIRPATPFA